MPLVKIEIIKGKPQEYKKQLCDVVTEALDISLSVPPEKLTQRVFELDWDAVSLPPDKSDKFILVEIVVFPGRDQALKKSAIVEITRLMVERMGIPANDVYILFQEQPKENWGSGGLNAIEYTAPK